MGQVKRKIIISGLVVLFMSILVGGNITAGTSNKDRLSSTVVIYQESERGITPYMTRYIVNNSYMRIDDGKPGTGFVLLDRKKETIYSVSVENESILLIKKKSMTLKKPSKLQTTVTSKKAPEKLTLEGRRAQEFDITVNNKPCMKNMTVTGVLPDFVSALKQYRAILATQHASNLYKTPLNMRNKCFMAYDIFQHSLHTAHGIIVHSLREDGKRSILRDYKRKQQAAASLFVLPAKYKQFTAGQVP